MGKRKRLNGDRIPLDSDKSKTCPNCGRNFREYDLVYDSRGDVHKACPYCEHKFS